MRGTTQVQCAVDGDSVLGWWDERALRRALENLVSNAAKYGDGQRKDIFEYLNRGEQAGTVGRGIGLPYVQEVAKRHGGTVALDSSDQAGTTFTLDIPIDSREFQGAGRPRAI